MQTLSICNNCGNIKAIPSYDFIKHMKHENSVSLCCNSPNYQFFGRNDGITYQNIVLYRHIGDKTFDIYKNIDKKKFLKWV